MSAGVFGVMVVRDEVDIIEVNIRYHLSLGVQRLLIIDNGSTDGTRSILEHLSESDSRVSWRPDDGPLHPSQLTTALAREAFCLGAKWIMPIDADEFWYPTGISLGQLLEATDAGALSVQVVNFVQRREQRLSAPGALGYVTMRVAEPVGPVEACERLVSEKKISYVQAVCPIKWLSRASAALTIDGGNHSVQGFVGPSRCCPQLTVMHAPLRAMSVLKAKAEHGRHVVEAGFLSGDSWHLRRWWQLEQQGELDDEWRANSYEGDSLDVFGNQQPVVYDPRLRDALRPWLPDTPQNDVTVGNTGPTILETRQPSAAMAATNGEADAHWSNQRYPGTEVANQAELGVLHEDVGQCHSLKESLRQAQAELQRAQAEVQSLAAQSEVRRHQIAATEQQLAQLLDVTENRGDETQGARSDFDRMASSRLARSSFALSATATALFRSVGQPSRVVRLLGMFSKDLLLRLSGRPVRLVLDTPASGALAFGSLAVTGWAISGAGAVESVSVLLQDGNILADSLEYGFDRPDVVVWIPWTLSARCGFAGIVPLDGLEPGQHTIVIRARDSAGNVMESQRTITVGRVAQARVGAGAWEPPLAVVSGQSATGAHRHDLATGALVPMGQARGGSARLGSAQGSGDTTAIDVMGQTMLQAFLTSGESMVFPECESPVVTIVVPTFKQAHYVYLTLLSVLAHTKDIPFEVVIVDNASADETELLLRRLINVRVEFNDSNVGFSTACNQGAGLARGEYVCFLNSDALPTAGWLSALVSTIENYPECGAVGGKLVHPSGRLQEAGSVIWQDGSTAGYGRGADPLDAQFRYVREVDYCSAACLLLQRDVFWRLGGFDERYRPAYCEDSDLCLSIWAAGYKVVYQPRCTLLHIEGGSSVATRAIALQIANREKMVAKWRNELATRGAASEGNMLVARERRRGRRVLVIDDYLPNPGLGQGMPRASALLRCLAELGYVATFLPVHSNRFAAAAMAYQEMGIEILRGGDTFRAELSARAGLFDAAIVSRPSNARLIPLVRALNPAAAVIYDAEAIFAFRTIGQASFEGSPLSNKDAEELVEAEVSLVDEADLVLVVSTNEQRAMCQRRPEREVVVWGDCVEVRSEPPGYSERSDILMAGYLGSSPNVDAARYFLKEIFPRIRARLNCKLLLVGADAPSEIAALAASQAESVEFLGFVDALQPYYDRCRLFVAPHRFAAGLPHKVVEAVAAGIPCVLSSLMADQLEFSDGEEAMVAADAENFAQKVVAAYEDQPIWDRLQTKSMKVVRERYSSVVAKRLVGRCVERAVELRSKTLAGTV
ncbi:MAG: glycosyltransferase [Chloroflexota bacterium]